MRPRLKIQIWNQLQIKTSAKFGGVWSHGSDPKDYKDKSEPAVLIHISLTVIMELELAF